VADFVDTAQLHVRAGRGGAGAVSFRREAHVAKGGPDGGDGGSGGSVFLKASSAQSSLIGLRDHPFRAAQDGGHGRGKNRHGAAGDDLVVELPVGTVVKTLEGDFVAEVLDPAVVYEIARGGRGGAGNARFLSNRRRAPAFGEQGELGEEKWFNLELKLMADVALVGEPNVGKSSLISVMSRARPKIADYPFTTLIPHLGVVVSPERGNFVVADVPGLIEGAADGRGLGHEFLRHIERARVLALVCDISQGERECLASVLTLLGELVRYRSELGERPRLLVGTKLDLCQDTSEASERARSVAAATECARYVVVSNATHEGVRECMGAFSEYVSRARESSSVVSAEVVHRPAPRFEVEVKRISEDRFELSGRDALRAVSLSDITTQDALSVVHGRLTRIGAIRALRRAGAIQGDEVMIGDYVFVYEDD